MGAKQSNYTNPNQPERFAQHKADGNTRVMDIDKVYKPETLKDKVVVVTGGNRGLGLAIVRELVNIGAKVVVTCRASTEIEGVFKVISGIDVTDNKCGEALVKGLGDTKVDVLVNNAGYFYEPVETLDKLAFDEEIKMIDICAVGPLRISSALYNAKAFNPGAKVSMITSQGGSISWRTVQNPSGGDYGHHMSKAAANMMGVLFSQEVKKDGISVSILHPGFNKTDMTKKYEKIWEVEGAVDPCVGAKRVCHEIAQQSMETTGKFINCEDGMEIPW